MRHRSKKTQSVYDAITPAREAFIEECPICPVCNMRGAEHIHEMICGSAHRMNCFKHRCCWLGLCAECHREIQSCVTLARQLAWKLLQDPAHYDRVQVLKLWGRALTAVTDGEVIEALREVLEERRA